jgi:hypothetical protein
MAYLDGMASFQNPSVAWGFKAKIDQIEQQPGISSARPFLERLASEQWTLFTLSRRNCVRSALSRLVAWRRGDRYHNDRQIPAEGLGKIHLEPERVVAAARRDRDERIRLLKTTEGLSSLDLSYEDHLCDESSQSDTSQRVFRILGAGEARVSSVFRKTSTAAFADSLLNAAEVVEAIRESEFAEYLEP